MEKFSLDGFQVVHTNDSSILQERRVFLGLTQKQVAEKAGIPFQNYQRFESGERKIRTASFQLACRVLTALELDITKFYNNDYILGEPVCESAEGLRFKATGKLIDEDVTEASDEQQPTGIVD